MHGDDMKPWLDTMQDLRGLTTKYRNQNSMAKSLEAHYLNNKRNNMSSSSSWARYVDYNSVQMNDIPVSLLLLGGDQQCLNSIMRHQGCRDSQSHRGTGAPCRYTMPFSASASASAAGVNDDAQPFGSVDSYLESLKTPPCADADDDHALTLIYTACLILVKIRLLGDMIALRDLNTTIARHGSRVPREIYDTIQSSIVQSPVTARAIRQQRRDNKKLDPVPMINHLAGQIWELFRTVQDGNPFFWRILVILIMALMRDDEVLWDVELEEGVELLVEIFGELRVHRKELDEEQAEAYDAYEAACRMAVVWYNTRGAIEILVEIGKIVCSE